MSTHYNIPRRYNNCHVVNILLRASNRALSDNPLYYGEIVERLPRGRCKSAKYKVKYNSHMAKMFGRTIPSCSIAEIDFKIQGDNFYYPILDVIDYGDEGSTDICGYLRTNCDLIRYYYRYFDEITDISK